MTTNPNRYTDPPIIERVVGVQMQPMSGWTGAHAGLFARESLDPSTWTNFSEHPRIQDKLERFGKNRELRAPGELTLELGGVGSRVWIETESGDRLIQLQNSRMHLNWRKREDKEYPPYRELRSEFDSHFNSFTAFLERHRLPSPVLNQWEITYIDHVPAGEIWDTPAEWQMISPIFVDPIGQSGGLSREGLNMVSTYVMPNEEGRLTISARHGVTKGDGTEVIVLEFTARGPITEGTTCGEMLDRGHSSIIHAFNHITSEDVKKKWGKQ